MAVDAAAQLLGDLCTVIDCEHKTAPAADGPTGLFSIGTRDLKRGRLLLGGAKQVTLETFAEWTARAVPQPGDLILAREAPVGAVAMVPWDVSVCLGQRTVLLRPKSETVAPRYLLYVLLGEEMQATMHSLSEGSTVPHLNVGDIRKLRIPIRHSPSEQEALVRFLGAIDDKIELNLHYVDTLDRLLRADYQARFIEFATAHELVDTPAGPIPQGWRIDALSSIAKRLNGSTNPATEPGELFELFSIPAFDAGAVAELSLGSAILSSKTRLPRPAILLSKLNPTTKRVWDARPNSERAVCSGEFIPLVTTGPAVPMSYLQSVLRFDDGLWDHIIAHVTGTTGSRQRVRPEEVLGAPVVVPPDDELRDYDAFAKPLFDRIHVLRQEVTSLEKLRDALLPRLVAGEAWFDDDILAEWAAESTDDGVPVG
jgi:type I restriction enzyme S subunit